MGPIGLRAAGELKPSTSNDTGERATAADGNTAAAVRSSATGDPRVTCRNTHDLAPDHNATPQGQGLAAKATCMREGDASPTGPADADLQPPLAGRIRVSMRKS